MTLIIKEPTKIKSKTNHSGTALGNPVFNTFLLLPLTKHSTEEVVKIQTQPTAQFNRIEVKLHSYDYIHLPTPPKGNLSVVLKLNKIRCSEFSPLCLSVAHPRLPYNVLWSRATNSLGKKLPIPIPCGGGAYMPPYKKIANYSKYRFKAPPEID